MRGGTCTYGFLLLLGPVHEPNGADGEERGASEGEFGGLGHGWRGFCAGYEETTRFKIGLEIKILLNVDVAAAVTSSIHPRVEASSCAYVRPKFEKA